MSDWSNVGAQLAQIGLPSLGTLVGNMVMPGVGGTIGGSVGRLAASAVAAALGVEPDPDKVSAVIEANPEGASIALAQIEAESKLHAAVLADVANARALESVAIEHASPVQWVPVVVTVLNYVIFGGVVLSVAMGWLREDGIIVGFALGAVTSAYQFWLGSSDASKRKDASIANMALTAQAQAPTRSNDISADIIARAGRL